MTCKKDSQFIKIMNGTVTRFFFIPILFGAILFIIGECFNRDATNSNHFKAMWYSSLFFSLFALISMLFIYFKTKDYHPRTSFGNSFRGFWAAFVILCWYNFLYTIYVIKFLSSSGNLGGLGGLGHDYSQDEYDYDDLDFKHKRNLDSIDSWAKRCNIICSILFGLGGLAFSFFAKEPIAASLCFLIYLGMVIFFYKVPKAIRLEKGSGVIDIIFMLLSLALYIFLTILQCRNRIKESGEIPNTSAQVYNTEKNNKILNKNK